MTINYNVTPPNQLIFFPEWGFMKTSAIGMDMDHTFSGNYRQQTHGIVDQSEDFFASIQVSKSHNSWCQWCCGVQSTVQWETIKKI